MNRHVLLHLLIAAAVIGSLWMIFAWPHINKVETGRTPEYPDLRPRDYASDSAQALSITIEGVKKMSGWRYVGSGTGPGGSAIYAEHSLWGLPIKEEITIQIERKKGRTWVSARSRSTSLPWDFGQNARNLRALYQTLDRDLP